MVVPSFEIKVVDWYTKDWFGTYGKDRDQVRYLYLPYITKFSSERKIEFNLDRHNPDDVSKTINDVNEENIDTLLHWLVKNYQGPRGRPIRLGHEFVSYRGLLSKILCSPYSTNDDLRICAIKVNGTIYMCKFLTPMEKVDVAMQFNNPQLLKFTKFGRVFEGFMGSEKPGVKPDGSKPYSELAELSFVYNTRVGSHKLLYSAELDALESEEGLDCPDEAYLYELKTCGDNVTVQKFNRQRLLAWWAQSALAKVDSIVVGYRSSEGMVRILEEIRVKEIPDQAYDWSADQCMLALQNFLLTAKRMMKFASQGDVYEFSWKAGRKRFTKPSVQIMQQENNECYFLPGWYLNWLKDGKERPE
ncbi:Hypothetical predicted protein [Cloeon dipterum]|nr:Hypothetical predicted protein [Cloeon dipterum]